MQRTSVSQKKALIVMGMMMAGANAKKLTNYMQPNCNIYAADGSCEKCSGWYWMNEEGACVQVNPQCKTYCEDNGHCTSCYHGYSLRKGECVIGNGCQNDDQSGSGEENHSEENCCESESCSESTSFHEGDLQSCEKCKKHHWCPQWTQNSDNCIKYEYVNKVSNEWRKAWFLGCQKVCTECKPYYYLNSEDKCTPNPDKCITANTDGTCMFCRKGFQPNQDGICVKMEKPIKHCLEYKYIDLAGKHYLNWFDGCTRICTKCKPGYKWSWATKTCARVNNIWRHQSPSKCKSPSPKPCSLPKQPSPCSKKSCHQSPCSKKSCHQSPCSFKSCKSPSSKKSCIKPKSCSPDSKKSCKSPVKSCKSPSHKSCKSPSVKSCKSQSCKSPSVKSCKSNKSCKPPSCKPESCKSKSNKSCKSKSNKSCASVNSVHSVNSKNGSARVRAGSAKKVKSNLRSSSPVKKGVNRFGFGNTMTQNAGKTSGNNLTGHNGNGIGIGLNKVEERVPLIQQDTGRIPVYQNLRKDGAKGNSKAKTTRADSGRIVAQQVGKSKGKQNIFLPNTQGTGFGNGQKPRLETRPIAQSSEVKPNSFGSIKGVGTNDISLTLTISPTMVQTTNSNVNPVIVTETTSKANPTTTSNASSGSQSSTTSSSSSGSSSDSSIRADLSRTQELPQIVTPTVMPTIVPNVQANQMVKPVKGTSEKSKAKIARTDIRGKSRAKIAQVKESTQPTQSTATKPVSPETNNGKLPQMKETMPAAKSTEVKPNLVGSGGSETTNNEIALTISPTMVQTTNSNVNPVIQTTTTSKANPTTTSNASSGSSSDSSSRTDSSSLSTAILDVLQSSPNMTPEVTPIVVPLKITPTVTSTPTIAPIVQADSIVKPVQEPVGNVKVKQNKKEQKAETKATTQQVTSNLVSEPATLNTKVKGEKVHGAQITTTQDQTLRTKDVKGKK